MGCGSARSTAVVSSKQLYCPLVVVGPSGVGKGTLLAKVFEKYKGLFSLSVSYTTRKSRPGEINGTHYHFIEKDQFDEMAGKDEFVEWCNVHDNKYGTAFCEIERIKKPTDKYPHGQIAVLEIDVQGAQKIHKKGILSNFVFILPCEDISKSEEVLNSRLRGRGTETDEQINTRVKNSLGEINKFKASKFFQHSVVNDNLDKAFEDFSKIIDKVYKEEIDNWKSAK